MVLIMIWWYLHHYSFTNFLGLSTCYPVLNYRWLFQKKRVKQWLLTTWVDNHWLKTVHNLSFMKFIWRNLFSLGYCSFLHLYCDLIVAQNNYMILVSNFSSTPYVISIANQCVRSSYLVFIMVSLLVYYCMKCTFFLVTLFTDEYR